MARVAVLAVASLFVLATGQEACTGAECASKADLEVEGTVNLLQSGYAIKGGTITKGQEAAGQPTLRMNEHVFRADTGDDLEYGYVKSLDPLEITSEDKIDDPDFYEYNTVLRDAKDESCKEIEISGNTYKGDDCYDETGCEYNGVYVKQESLTSNVPWYKKKDGKILYLYRDGDGMTFWNLDFGGAPKTEDGKIADESDGGYIDSDSWEFEVPPVGEHDWDDGGKITLKCKAATCTCANGEAATGAACQTAGAKCATCNEGYILIGSDCKAEPNAPAAGGTCKDPDPKKDGDTGYQCPKPYTAKDGASQGECTDETSCLANCCEAPVCSKDSVSKSKCKCGTKMCNKGDQCIRKGDPWSENGTVCEAACKHPEEKEGYKFGAAGGKLTIEGFSAYGVQCAFGYTGIVTYKVCEKPGSEYSVAGCKAECRVNDLKGEGVGYYLEDVTGDLTIEGFNPRGGDCDTGYGGTVKYEVCEKAGGYFKVSGCKACSVDNCYWCDGTGATCKECLKGYKLKNNKCEEITTTCESLDRTEHEGAAIDTYRKGWLSCPPGSGRKHGTNNTEVDSSSFQEKCCTKCNSGHWYVGPDSRSGNYHYCERGQCCNEKGYGPDIVDVFGAGGGCCIKCPSGFSLEKSVDGMSSCPPGMNVNIDTQCCDACPSGVAYIMFNGKSSGCSKDGKVEMLGWGRIGSTMCCKDMFDVLDTDHNGKVTIQEFHAQPIASEWAFEARYGYPDDE